MTDLTTLVGGLAAAIAELDDETHLIISRPGSSASFSETGPNRFVQFARSGPLFRAESAGERYLTDDDRLTADDRVALEGLGWMAPDEGGNYWIVWEDPVPFQEVATVALETLRRVHDVEHVEQLAFNAAPRILETLGVAGDSDAGWVDNPGESTQSSGIGGSVAHHLAYYDYDPDEVVTCGRCGWSGIAGDHQEVHRDVLDVTCGSCDTILIIAAFPTLEETRAAAAAGDSRALADLPGIEDQAVWRERAASTLLTDPTQLPDLDGNEVVIDWDLTDGEDRWQVLRHGEREIWRETAYYESFERFKEVFRLLLERYGRRFAGLRPTLNSQWWLGGDRVGVHGQVDLLNSYLGAPKYFAIRDKGEVVGLARFDRSTMSYTRKDHDTGGRWIEDRTVGDYFFNFRSGSGWIVSEAEAHEIEATLD